MSAPPCPPPGCAHCGDPCPGPAERPGDLPFCCAGCRTVYGLLHDHGLQQFYQLAENPGRSQRETPAGDYGWLTEERLAARLARYRDAERWVVELELPAIHCMSCVWLLEQLPTLAAGVRECRVDVTRKLATLDFHPRQTNLHELAELLARLGYPPVLRPAGSADDQRTASNRPLLYRVGVAGFCFGNIMLLSFPEYLGIHADHDGAGFGRALGLLMLVLSLPVVGYAGAGFLRDAWRGLRKRRYTLDFSIALGMVALFGRSAYEILSGTGAGYLDSLAGLVFFLLVGRWFQSYTFGRLSFDRDHRDYFPIGAYREGADGALTPVDCGELAVNDHLLVRPGQVVPVDGVLRDGQPEVRIDYSFVTGESRPRAAVAGAEVFAGGRATTRALRLRVTRPASSSYLLRLWQGQHERSAPAVTPPQRLVRYFTWAILTLAAGTLAYWYPTAPGLAYRSATAVLIIACPCALALAAPFAYGTLQRLLGRAGCYLRDPAVILRLATADAFVFDKTGTLVAPGAASVLELDSTSPGGGVILAMARQSTHPVSQALVAALTDRGVAPTVVPAVTERAGRGLELEYGGRTYRVGGAAFCRVPDRGAGTYAAVDKRIILCLRAAPAELRPGAGMALRALAARGRVYLLSGDAPPPDDYWSTWFPDGDARFALSPFEKAGFVDALREGGHLVVMIGDGLNDAGALRRADVGLAVSEDTAAFSPASDGILAATRLGSLPGILRAAARMRYVTAVAYGFAALYNVVGLSFAVSGTLSPVVAAILMPLSSLTVVSIACAGGWMAYRRDICHRGA
ncbi:heavy metal translocating P-type ATPase [Lewinella sp. IMCC34183]|uniref:heavy metal translocating P-type ATPase n=1 Tax=Lewinella sp. IMCC34183 TaxID=2248762 RepID=UPI000E270042|nr:heavy metal translocating P-type ATPase metal-binding domain-containing protein [Lewinella sp. IMCC34183]